MHESFLAYRKMRWLRWAGLLAIVSIVAYIVHSPRVPANGATWLGYTLGTIGALLILWLMMLGIRKRSYSSTMGTVKGWLSAHVYLGLALIIVATLHTGFQFGWNLHTLAYTLMCIVIVSGFFGMVVYVRYQEMMSGNHGGKTSQEMLNSLAEFDNQLQRVSSDLPPAVAAAISSSISGTELGGGAWSILKAKDHSVVALPTKSGKPAKAQKNVDQTPIINWLAAELAVTDPAHSAKLQDALTLVGNKQSLLRRIREHSRIRALMQAWLFLHIPLSFGLLAALASHIVVVFLYW